MGWRKVGHTKGIRMQTPCSSDHGDAKAESADVGRCDDVEPAAKESARGNICPSVAGPEAASNPDAALPGPFTSIYSAGRRTQQAVRPGSGGWARSPNQALHSGGPAGFPPLDNQVTVTPRLQRGLGSGRRRSSMNFAKSFRSRQLGR